MATAPHRDPMAALEAIYRRHHGLVQWVLRSRGVSEVALDDYTHDVFVAICRRLPERDADLPLRTWVARVARNVAFSRRRSAARDRDRDAQQDPPAPPLRPDELFERHEAWQALSAFLDDLRPEQREVFVMVDVTGMRVSEVAAATGKPANTLHSRLKVARTRFTERFGGTEAAPTLVAAARRDRRVPASQRRNTWAAITASVEGLHILPAATTATASAAAHGGWLGSTSLTAFVVGAGAMTVVAVGIGLPTSSPPEATPRSTPAVAAVESTPPPRVTVASTPSATPLPSASPSISQAAAEPTAAVRHKAQRPAQTKAVDDAAPDEKTDADAALVRAVQTLRRAREQLQAGHARDALRTVDALQTEFGALARDLRRVELDAACRVGDGLRAQEAAAALRALGAHVNDGGPCPAQTESVP